MNQFNNLKNQLPPSTGRSIQDDRTTILMEYEYKRRQYNRINKEQLSLYTFICMIGSPFKFDGMEYMMIEFNPVWALRYQVRKLKESKNKYLTSGKYRNNKQVRV